MVDLQRCLREVRATRYAHGGDDHAAVSRPVQHHAPLQRLAGVRHSGGDEEPGERFQGELFRQRICPADVRRWHGERNDQFRE